MPLEEILHLSLTSMSIRRYFIISQLAMLPGTIVYLNAGLQLSKIESVDSIFTPALIGAFSLIGLFPLMAKRLIMILKKRNKN